MKKFDDDAVDSVWGKHRLASQCHDGPVRPQCVEDGRIGLQETGEEPMKINVVRPVVMNERLGMLAQGAERIRDTD